MLSSEIIFFTAAFLLKVTRERASFKSFTTWMKKLLYELYTFPASNALKKSPSDITNEVSYFISESRLRDSCFCVLGKVLQQYQLRPHASGLQYSEHSFFYLYGVSCVHTSNLQKITG